MKDSNSYFFGKVIACNNHNQQSANLQSLDYNDKVLTTALMIDTVNIKMYIFTFHFLEELIDQSNE